MNQIWNGVWFPYMKWKVIKFHGSSHHQPDQFLRSKDHQRSQTSPGFTASVRSLPPICLELNMATSRLGAARRCVNGVPRDSTADSTAEPKRPGSWGELRELRDLRGCAWDFCLEHRLFSRFWTWMWLDVARNQYKSMKSDVILVDLKLILGGTKSPSRVDSGEIQIQAPNPSAFAVKAQSPSPAPEEILPIPKCHPTE